MNSMKPIMDEQDELESLKEQIRAKSEALLRLKRLARELSWPNAKVYSASARLRVLQKLIDETPS
jgi:hypothetical protein